MRERAVILVRGLRPNHEEAAKLVALRTGGSLARVVSVPRGREDTELEPCSAAYSFHAELIAPYGDSGVLLSVADKRVEENVPSAFNVPDGYVIEKKGPYYRLIASDGSSPHEKMLHKAKMEEFLRGFSG